MDEPEKERSSAPVGWKGVLLGFLSAGAMAILAVLGLSLLAVLAFFGFIVAVCGR